MTVTLVQIEKLCQLLLYVLFLIHQHPEKIH